MTLLHALHDRTQKWARIDAPAAARSGLCSTPSDRTNPWCRRIGLVSWRPIARQNTYPEPRAAVARGEEDRSDDVIPLGARGFHVLPSQGAALSLHQRLMPRGRARPLWSPVLTGATTQLVGFCINGRQSFAGRSAGPDSTRGDLRGRPPSGCCPPTRQGLLGRPASADAIGEPAGVGGRADLSVEAGRRQSDHN